MNIIVKRFSKELHILIRFKDTTNPLELFVEKRHFFNQNSQ